MPDGNTPVAIVGVRFLNARPLLAGLEAEIPAPFRYRLETAEPSACADRLAAGDAVAGLVPVAALPGLPEVSALPELGIVSRGRVRSVLLVARTPLAEVRTLAAHTASRSSVALARLLLAERWGARPAVVPARPPLAAMLAAADAAVLIGDPALLAHGRTGFDEVDLAAAWEEWTGLPFVFALWGVRPGAPKDLGPLLERSYGFARERWAELVPGWARAHGVGEEVARSYLDEALTYRLGEREREAVRVFLHEAAAAGVLPSHREVWCAV